MTNDLEKRLTRLEDITEIQQLLNRYVYMLVTMDFEHIYDECFSQTREDVSIQASDSGVYIGGEHIKERFFGKFMEFIKTVPGAFTMHLTCNPVIEISEDGLRARSVAPSPGCATDPQVREALWIWGTFMDDYIKENGSWRILHALRQGLDLPRGRHAALQGLRSDGGRAVPVLESLQHGQKGR